MFLHFLDPIIPLALLGVHEALMVALAVVALVSPSRRDVAIRLIEKFRWRPRLRRRKKS